MDNPGAREVTATETVSVEWGIRYERGWNWDVTFCESEEAARELQAASGGEVVCRKTFSGTWS